MTVNLNGARVLLTGATGGIGHAIARALHARGAELILTGRRTEVLDELAADVGGTTIGCDLSDPAAVSKLMDEVGDIDVLVANAALPAVGAIADYTEDGIDRDLDVNLRAPIVLTRWATRQMLPRGRGHIVLIGSLAGRAPSPLTAMYNATKFGLRGFALAHRDDLHGTGVSISVVEPGFVSDAGMFVESGMQLPKGARAVSPDDVARGVIRSIDKDLGEVMVAPPEMKFLSGVALISPRFNSAIQRRVGAADIIGGHKDLSDRS
jgi:short-subunit dehydrogenase